MSNLFDRILELAKDLHKQGRTDFAHAVKTCPHREDIFKMHDEWRAANGKPSLRTEIK